MVESISGPAGDFVEPLLVFLEGGANPIREAGG